MDDSVATVTTIKAPLWQTLAFVQYHLHIGIDHMFLYFDDPQDVSIPTLRTIESVTCIPCNKAHWRGHNEGKDSPVQSKQMANATDAFERARELGLEWLVHLDGDELLHADASLSELFAQSPPEAEVLLFPTKEALPQQLAYGQPFQEISLFKFDPVGHLLQGDVCTGFLEEKRRGLADRIYRYKKQLVNRMGYNHPDLVDSFLLGHTNGKAATRTTSPVTKIGNHRPIARSSHTLSSYAIRRGAVLHFDCMGYEPWCKKWSNRLDGSSHFNMERLRPDRKRILEMFSRAQRSGRSEDLRALYKRMYVLSPLETMVLRSLGFIERIRLSEALFDPINCGSLAANGQEK